MQICVEFEVNHMLRQVQQPRLFNYCDKSSATLQKTQSFTKSICPISGQIFFLSFFFFFFFFAFYYLGIS